MRVKSVVSMAVATAVAFGASVGVLTRIDHHNDHQVATPAGSSAELASERLDANGAIAFWMRRVENNRRDYLSRTQLASQYLRVAARCTTRTMRSRRMPKSAGSCAWYRPTSRRCW